MTIQAELWQLILASLIPTIAVVFRSGVQAQKIDELEKKVKKVEAIPEVLAEIKNDMKWVKEALAYATRDKFSDR